MEKALENHPDDLTLQAFREGLLLDHASRTEVEGHLGSCNRCRESMVRYERLDLLLAHYAPATVPSGLTDAVLEKVLTEQRSRFAVGKSGSPFAGIAWAGLALVLSGTVLVWPAVEDPASLVVRLSQVVRTLISATSVSLTLVKGLVIAMDSLGNPVLMTCAVSLALAAWVARRGVVEEVPR